MTLEYEVYAINTAKCDAIILSLSSSIYCSFYILCYAQFNAFDVVNISTDVPYVKVRSTITSGLGRQPLLMCLSSVFSLLSSCY
jgi:hypothetical protein